MQVVNSASGWDDFEPYMDDDLLLDLDDIEFTEKDMLRDDRIGIADDLWCDLGVTVSINRLGWA